MKNLQKLFSIAMLVALVATLFSCSKDEEAEIDTEAGIIGKWEITSTQLLLNGQNPDNFAQVLGMTPEEFRKAYELDGIEVEDGSMEFMSDKRFEAEGGYGEGKGTWSVDANKSLVMDYDGSDAVITNTITSLTANSATLSTKDQRVTELAGNDFTVNIEYITNLKK